jgi:hypothetical protein
MTRRRRDDRLMAQMDTIENADREKNGTGQTRQLWDRMQRLYHE